MTRRICISRGFYCWNSEVGRKTLIIASFYLRAVCMNRNLWVENFEEITIWHSKVRGPTLLRTKPPPIDKLCQFFACAICCRYQGRAGADRCPD